MKAKKSNKSGKVGVLLRGLEASSSKPEPSPPQLYTPKRKDTGKRVPGSKSVSQSKKNPESIMDYKKGGKTKGGMSGLDAAEKQVYKRGLAAYMSSGNRPKVSQHAWAMARVKSAFGKREAAKIRAGKSGKGKKK